MKRKHPTLSTLSNGEQKRDPTLSDGEQKRDLLLCIFDLFICIFGYQKDVTVGESLFPSLCVASTKGFRGDRRKAIATYRRLLKCSLTDILSYLYHMNKCHPRIWTPTLWRKILPNKLFYKKNNSLAFIRNIYLCQVHTLNKYSGSMLKLSKNNWGK